MIKWLEDNPAGITLASICVGLVLISFLLMVLWSLPPSVPVADGGESDDIARLELPELTAGGSIEQYAVITDRPVFNENRLPSLDDELEDDLLADDEGEEDVEAPDIELAGVIITPSIRMATLRQKGEAESLVAFEGRPLEGDFGTWQISRIEPRQVTLASGQGEEIQLDLQIHKAVIAEPPKPKPPADADSESGEEGQGEADENRPLTRAEEIRQRIAERREELRRAAEAKEQKDQMSYKEAIQSMIGKNRKRQTDDENENEDQ